MQQNCRNKRIYQYPLFEKKEQHIIRAAQKLLEKINLQVESNPQIEIDKNSIQIANQKFQNFKYKINILLGIGGSGPTKEYQLKI